MPKKAGQLKEPHLLGVVGERFKRERKALGITHEWLSIRTGVERFSIGRFETGTRGIESASLVAILCAGAEKGMNVGFVLTGKRDPQLDVIRSALLEPAVVEGLRQAGLAAFARAPKASGR